MLKVKTICLKFKIFLPILTVGLVHDNNDTDVQTDDESEEEIPKEHNPILINVEIVFIKLLLLFGNYLFNQICLIIYL